MVPISGQDVSNQIFIFLIDRSGSMDGDKMEMAKDALKLFILSLPKGAMFEVVSFGSHFEISSKDKLGYVNDDQNVEKIFKEIDSYGASFGGTNILQPMKYLIESYLIDVDK
jgi:uncharacterized protein with von Willebrand factor type A (vWA) domain